MGSPLSVQMLRQHTKAKASGNITTAIGASLPTSLILKGEANIKPHS